MGKLQAGVVTDGIGNYLKSNAIKETVCSSQPTVFADIATYKLADVTMAGGDFTLAAGDVSGRKVTMGAKSGIVIASSGTATHVCLDDGSTLLEVTTCTSQALTANGSNTVNIPAWKNEVAAPT